jgi:excisionase family DNA binding protein
MTTTSTTEAQAIYVDCKNAAKILGLTTWDVWKLVDDGALEHERSGELILIPLQRVADYAATMGAGRQ